MAVVEDDGECDPAKDGATDAPDCMLRREPKASLVAATPVGFRESVRFEPDSRAAALPSEKACEIRRFGSSHDEFELGKIMAKGGQATVYGCVRVNTQYAYAAKVYDIDLPQSTQREKAERKLKLSNMRREIKVMRELHHPKFVNLYEAFYEPSSNPQECIVVMDLCVGGDLHSRIEKERAQAENAGVPFRGLGGVEIASKYIATQILDGLGYMHDKQLIHRDLKLENILITKSFPATEVPQGVPFSDQLPELFHDVKIADLGLSREINERSAPQHENGDDNCLKRTMTAVGTLGFVSPEVLEKQYDERADFWSFGVMMYVMLCAQYPFRVSTNNLTATRYKEEVQELIDCESWKLATAQAKDFVNGLLKIDAQERLGLNGCLTHVWLDSNDSEAIDIAAWRRVVSEDRILGVIEEVRGWTGSALDSVRLMLRNGSVNAHGGRGGLIERRFTLNRDELVLAVMQESQHKYLGNGVTFYTSAGRIMTILGTEARKRQRFVAPSDCQIVGLQFQEHILTGIHVSEKPEKGERGAVFKISGRTGHAVDKVVLELRNGKIRSYGGEGGTEQGPWTLKLDEYIIIVEQNVVDAYLGNSIVFYTSAGNVIRLLGMVGGKSHRFVAPQGHQICGVEFEGSHLVRASICPSSGNLDVKTVLEDIIPLSSGA